MARKTGRSKTRGSSPAPEVSSPGLTASATGPGPSDSPAVWATGLGLFALAATVRLAVVLQLHAHPLLQPLGQLDSGVAADLGRQVAAGDLALRAGTGGQPFFFAPLYVYFLGLVFALGGSPLAAQVVQALLGGAAVLLLWRAARPWFGEPAAPLAGALLALTGPVVFHEAILLQSALDPFLTALALYAVARAAARSSLGAWLLAGASIGLFALNRPNALAWGLALGACVPLLARRAERRRGFVQGALVLVGLALAIAPATARNVVVSAEPVPISSHGGLNFYIGNRAEADGTYRAVPGITPDVRGQARDARRRAEQEEGRTLSARETDAHFRRLAWRWILTHPLDAAGLVARKVAYLLSATELALNYSYAYYAGDEPTLLRWLPVGAWLLVPLGLAGLVDRARLAPRTYLAWALVVPAYGLSVAAFFVSSRYRLPLLVPLAAGAGFAVVRLVRLARSRDARGLGQYAAGLFALATVTLWPHRLDDGRSEERAAMLLWLVDNGRAEQALRRLPDVEAAHPEPARLLLRLGQALDDAREAGVAAQLLERSLSLDPSRPETRLALGRALFDAGRVAESIPHLRAAVDSSFRPDLAGFLLVRALAEAGETEEAAARLGRLVLPPSSDAASLLVIGSVALQVRRPDLALRLLERGLAQDPRLAGLHEKRGLALLMLERAADARAELDEARRLDPASASACLNLAVLDAQEGRLDEARALAKEALRLQPGYGQARGLLAALERAR